ncbi:Peptidoglycan-binding domain 1 protein [Alkalidesulfovibrio alkalitolerans DSM 16529]|uniref:Peptidoglycan-binding domain 1 protein n=1 Tax=Alkalidesulfovibrio alkalitolerans DSM 16529 TaxID=1121439 RepID=S7ULZ8_9BACT|nr:Peptidoglycan-binding domain 1 protein [Alkalidesulfovibrio alkalitolerans DSM 16529]
MHTPKVAVTACNAAYRPVRCECFATHRFGLFLFVWLLGALILAAPVLASPAGQTTPEKKESATPPFDAPAAPAPHWKPLIERLAGDGFSRENLTRLFARPDAVYDAAVMGRKMRSLYEIKYRDWMYARVQKRLDALGWKPGPVDGKPGDMTMASVRAFQAHHGLQVSGWPSWALLDVLERTKDKAPANFTVPPPPKTTAATPHLVYRSALTPERVDEAVRFYKARKDMFREVEKRYGVPPEVALGILNVETVFGAVLGRHSAFLALASMAATREWDDLAPSFEGRAVLPDQMPWLIKRTGEKADWAYAELTALLDVAEACGRDPLDIPGSVYGAIGICQFMPTNVQAYGIDADGDGVIDLFVEEDAVHSLANFLKAHGFRPGGQNSARQRRAIYRYNQSQAYVNTVWAMADKVRPLLGR